MADYDVYTDNGLTKWIIRGTGSGSRLSDVMDDTSPDSGQVNATYGVWYKISNGTYVDTAAPEYTIALTTEPDGDAGDDLCIYHKEDTDWLVRGTAGSLNSGEWDWAAGTLSIRLLDDGDPDTEDLYIYYAWSHFMTETIEDAIYHIHIALDIGDGVVTTSLTSLNEHVYFDDLYAFSVADNARLDLGELYESWGINGSYWSISGVDNSNTELMDGSGSIFKMYSSHIHNRAASQMRFEDGSVYIKNSTFSAEYYEGDPDYRRGFVFRDTVSYLALEDVYFNDVFALVIELNADVFENVHIHRSNWGYDDTGSAVGTRSTKGLKATSIGSAQVIQGYGSRAIIIKAIDPDFTISNKQVNSADGEIHEAYTCNLTVGDKDGTLTGMTATVTLDGSDSGTASTEYDTEAFSEDTTNGVLTEQTVTTRKWVGTDETLTNYNKFRLTVSASGYETLVLENITIDSPVDWHLELQPYGRTPNP